jgi:hypothetical protein
MRKIHCDKADLANFAAAAALPTNDRHFVKAKSIFSNEK